MNENIANTIAGIINEYGGRVNDEATRFTVAARIRAIAFEPVVCDENNNPPLVVDAAGLVVDVGPVRFHYTPGNIHVTGFYAPPPSPTIDIVANQQQTYERPNALAGAVIGPIEEDNTQHETNWKDVLPSDTEPTDEQ